ncbi:MAG: DUF488 domain-containing protein [Actinobacteria bacterium]|nr:DUF488 domain-containing protein [Actinomycetota bacterium]
MGDPACWVDQVCPDCGAFVEGGEDGDHRCRGGARLLTVGHGTAGEDDLTALFRGAGVDLVVDVRRFPGSRRHPHVARDELARWLPAAGIGYRWEPRLGGRRQPAPASPHVGIRNPSFRAYADHLDSDEFRAALGEVLDEARERRVAVMCSESVWWRCHRRFIADAAVLLHAVEVRHLMHDGRLAEHRPTDVARVEDGQLVYDAGEPTLPL